MRTIIAIFSDHSHNLFRNIIILLILIFTTVFVSLRVGIYIDYLKLPRYNLSGLYIKLNKNLILTSTIERAYLKEDNITISGSLRYDLIRDRVDTKAKVSLADIEADINATKYRDSIEFNISSNEFRELSAIIDKFDLQDIHREWILYRVKPQSYRVVSLKGEAIISKDGYEIDLDTLQGDILFDKTKINFKDGLKAIDTKKVELKYRKNSLYFKLNEPIYEGKSLEGSRVAIIDITEDNPILKLDINMTTPYDKIMDTLLDRYGVYIPIMQKSGEVEAYFHADIGLVDESEKFLVDVNFGRGDILLHNVKLPIVSGRLKYAKSAITLYNIFLKDRDYRGKVDGKIDLDKKRVKLLFDAKKISLGDKFFLLKNRKLPIVIDYKKDTKIEIPKLSLKLSQKRDKVVIKLNNLNKLKPYLLDKSIVEKGGYVTIETKKFERFSFKGMMKKPSSFLYERENRCLSTIKFKGRVTPKGERLYAFNKRFYYNKNRSQLRINNLNIDLKRFLKSKSKSDKRRDRLVIIGKNSNLRYGKYRLLTDSYDIEIKPNGDIKAIGSAGGDIIKFSKKRNRFFVQAFRIKDKILHPLIDFNGLKGGRYSIKKSGNPDRVMRGEIIIEGGVMRDFKTYNNTLAFINTIPALAVLHDPGFSKKGFEIREGLIEYKMIGTRKIVFDKIYIKGKSANIVGKGSIDIKRNRINMNLAIQVGRTLGKVVGSIPLLGYILLGKDKSMTVGLKITGSLNKPKIRTTVADDILTLPLELIKRTLLAPKVLGKN